MKKLIISFLAVAAFVAFAAGADYRQVIIIPVNTTAVTNKVFSGMAMPTPTIAAHLDNWMIGACASATNVTVTLDISGSGYTNAIAVVNATPSANTATAISVKPVVGVSDSFITTIYPTNTVPTYIYVNMFQ